MFTIIGLMLTGMLLGYLLRKRDLKKIHQIITLLIWLLYIVARSAGKISGSYLSCRATSCSPAIQKYLGITLLLLSMVGCMAYHAVQALRRYQRHRQRMEEIQKYYESCLNPVLLPASDPQD
jgi:uncharacterized membrane protein YbjE (DUF340 family)